MFKPRSITSYTNNLNLYRLFTSTSTSLPLRHKVLILSGPTASYKSYLSTILCDKLNGEIITADSIQVYKNLNIATGKLSNNYLKLYKHHLLDILPFNYPNFNVHLYTQLAEVAINDIISRGKTPIFIGGSGFFLKCLLYGMNEYGNSDAIKRQVIEKKIKELIPEDVEDENRDERWKTL